MIARLPESLFVYFCCGPPQKKTSFRSLNEERSQEFQEDWNAFLLEAALCNWNSLKKLNKKSRVPLEFYLQNLCLNPKLPNSQNRWLLNHKSHRNKRIPNARENASNFYHWIAFLMNFWQIFESTGIKDEIWKQNIFKWGN